MCIRCSNIEPIDFRTVPIKYLLRFLKAKEVIFSEYNADKFVDVAWVVDPVDFGYITSVKYEMNGEPGMFEAFDMHFPVDDIPPL